MSAPPPTSPKIFCLGFNKTGTTSLHQFFLEHGLRSQHSVTWPHISHLPHRKTAFAEIDAFSDGELADFVRLRQSFPDSLMILNTRDPRAWLQSRIKHALRMGHPDTWEEGQPPNGLPQLGWMGRQFFADERLAIDTWLITRAIYHRQVRRHFHGDPRFLEIDITKTPYWQTTLSAFLAARGVPLVTSGAKAFAPANTRPKDEITDQALLERYFNLADKRLAAVGTLITELG